MTYKKGGQLNLTTFWLSKHCKAGFRVYGGYLGAIYLGIITRDPGMAGSPLFTI